MCGVVRTGRTALDHARKVNNPVYIGMMQNAIEMACTYRGRYILTAAATADVDCGASVPCVVHAAIDRRSGMRVFLRCEVLLQSPRLLTEMKSRPYFMCTALRRVRGWPTMTESN